MGGDTMPTASEIKGKMSNLEDEFDTQEPDPEPHYFEPGTSIQDEMSTKNKEMLPMILDTSLDSFIPALPDQFIGPKCLRFFREQLPMELEIPHFPRHAKQPYYTICYEHEHTPKEQPHKVEHIIPDDTEEQSSVHKPPSKASDQHRTSGCTKKEPIYFAGNMKAVWRPGKVLESFAKAAMLGIILLLPTVIIAKLITVL